MTFCDLTIYNDKPLLIRLCTDRELDLLPNFGRFPLNICDACGIPTGDDYPITTLGPVPLGLAYVLLVETNPFYEHVVIFFRLCSSNIPGYYLDFGIYRYNVDTLDN